MSKSRGRGPSAVPASDRYADGWHRLKRWFYACRALYYRARRRPTLPHVELGDTEEEKRKILEGIERCILDADRRRSPIPTELMLYYVQLKGELGEDIAAAPRSSVAAPRRSSARKSVRRQ